MYIRIYAYMYILDEMNDYSENGFAEREITMTTSVHEVKVAASKEEVWAFLNNKENWAVLMPGYLHHEMTSPGQMIWVFQGDFGFIKKAVKLQLEETESIEQEKLAFRLIGLSDNINGQGHFTINEVDEHHCSLIGSLSMEAGGFLAAMINPVLQDFVPKTVEALVEAMALKL